VLAREKHTWRLTSLRHPDGEVPSTLAQSRAEDYLLENETTPPRAHRLLPTRLYK